jgi:gliding motility-associated-like protein
MINIDVSVQNFTDITTFQFSTNWDSTVIEYVGLDNLNSDLDLTIDLFGQPDQLGRGDALTVSWFDVSFEGFDLPDNAILFTIQFNVIGDPCDETNVTMTNEPRVIDFNDTQGQIDAVPSPGTVEVTPCMMGGGDLVLTVSEENGENGDNVCVQVTADGFQEIVSAGWNLTYDPTILEFTGFQNFGLPGLDQGSFNVNAGSGEIIMTYLPPGGMNASVPDGTVLYEICFNIIGSAGQVSPIPIVGLPGRPIDIFQQQMGMDVQVDPEVNDGSVTVGGQFSGLIISAPGGSVEPGTNITVPIIFQNANDIQGIQDISLEWDPTVLEFVESKNRTAPGPVFTENTSMVGNGVYGFIYAFVDPVTGGGWTPASDSVAFIEICFNVIGDCDDTSPLEITDIALIVDGQGNVIPYQGLDNEILVECATCEADPLIANVSCDSDSDGSIDLQLSNCDDITDIQWSGGIPGGPDATTATGLEVGVYSVTITYDGGNEELIINDLVVEKDEIILEQVDITKSENGDDGAIDIELSGVSGSYNYMWSNNETSEDISGLAPGDYTVTVTDASDSDCVFEFGPFTVPGPPELAPEVNNISCAGEQDGSIILNVSDGAEPYSFNWSCDGTIDDETGDITGLGAGECSVTVTDANDCETTMTFTIIEPDPITIDDVDIQSDPNGLGEGSISLTVSGGTGDLTYDWSPMAPDEPIITDLTCGLYELTITDENGCELTDMFDVEGLNVTGVVTGVQCFGENNGMVQLEVECGSGDYAYDWSCDGNVASDGSITNLEAGECTVTVTDNLTGISIIRSFNIPGVDAPLNALLELGSCPDVTEASVSVSGGTAPYDISWNTTPPQSGPTATDLQEGQNLVVMILDNNGCEFMVAGTNPVCSGDGECYIGREVITPNSDGLNDFFTISCIENAPNRLMIYSRWGEEVYTANNYQNEWFGQDTGNEDVEESTYIWVLEVYPTSGQTQVYRGTVTVLRDLN